MRWTETAGRAASRSVSIGLSLSVTPLVLLLSDPSALYLANQDEFAYRWTLLLPFLLAAGTVLGIGIALYSLSRRSAVARAMLWAYYSSGLLYLVYRVILGSAPALANSLAFLGVIALSFVACVVIGFERLPVSRGRLLFSALGAALMLYEGANFAAKVDRADKRPSLLDRLDYSPRSESPDEAVGLPNVYHLVLDQYVGDLFQILAPERVRRSELAGFVNFSNTVAQWGKTRHSMPSIFLGQVHDRSKTNLAWRTAGFDSEQSFISGLTRRGYRTFAFHFFEEKEDSRLLHHAARHSDHVSTASVSDILTLRDLWFASSLPRVLSTALLGEGRLAEIESGRTTSNSSPYVSYRAFQDYMSVEPLLPASGRYTLVHLILPHGPYVWDATCREYSAENPQPTEIVDRFVAQSGCATKLVFDFVRALKELGRYDSSLIVIHSDHGGELVVRKGKVVPVHPGSSRPWTGPAMGVARSDALLLVKPPRSHDGNTLYRESKMRSRLIDIAPSILHLLKIEATLPFEGRSLFGPRAREVARKQYYHWSDGFGDELTIVRWDMSDGMPRGCEAVSRRDYWLQPEAIRQSEERGSQGEDPIAEQNRESPTASVTLTPEERARLQCHTPEEMRQLRARGKEELRQRRR